MRNKEKERAGEVAGWLAIFLMIMIVVGILLDGKMSELLDVYLKNQVAQQTGILAEIAQEKLNSEIETLEEMSEYIGKNEDNTIMTVFVVSPIPHHRIRSGIILSGGTFLKNSKIYS